MLHCFGCCEIRSRSVQLIHNDHDTELLLDSNRPNQLSTPLIPSTHQKKSIWANLSTYFHKPTNYQNLRQSTSTHPQIIDFNDRDDDAHSYNNDELALINNRIHTIKDSTCTDVHEIDINVKDEDNDDADDGGYDETEGLIIKGENGIDMDNVRTVDDILEKMFN